MSTIFQGTTVDLSKCTVLHLLLKNKPIFSTQSPAYTINKLCREFLSNPSFEGCLISPKRKNDELFVVGLVDVFSSPTFEQWIHDENIAIVCRSDAGFEDVSVGMRFSLAFFLESGEWYRVGDAFMQGSFLHGEKHCLPRISFEPLCSTSGRILFRINADFVNIQPMEQWLCDPPAADGLLPGRRPVFCLPKLGFGRLIGMHRSLPSHSPFGSYKEMRQYWKISYGYDLPKAEPDCYFDVIFNGRKHSFLYPYFCVLAEKPTQLFYRESHEKTQTAIKSFANALAEAAKVILGQKTQFEKHSGDEAMVRSLLWEVPNFNKKKNSGFKRSSWTKGVSEATKQRSPVKNRSLGMRSMTSRFPTLAKPFKTPSKPVSNVSISFTVPVKKPRVTEPVRARFRRPVIEFE